jgi:hypothetical protein
MRQSFHFVVGIFDDELISFLRLDMPSGFRWFFADAILRSSGARAKVLLAKS